MVVGSGGTTRAAIYALKSLGYTPIFIAARNSSRVDELAGSFPADYDIRMLDSPAQVAKLPASSLLGVVVSTIPADKPIDPAIEGNR